MGVIFEESETDYPSFNMKKKPFLKNESEFEQVIDSILNENKEKSPFRRDDLSDDDEDLEPSASGRNAL